MKWTVNGHSFGIGWLIALCVFLACVADLVGIWASGPAHVDAWLTGLLALAMLVG
jgi:hypothetical protein